MPAANANNSPTPRRSTAGGRRRCMPRRAVLCCSSDRAIRTVTLRHSGAWRLCGTRGTAGLQGKRRVSPLRRRSVRRRRLRVAPVKMRLLWLPKGLGLGLGLGAVPSKPMQKGGGRIWNGPSACRMSTVAASGRGGVGPASGQSRVRAGRWRARPTRSRSVLYTQALRGLGGSGWSHKDTCKAERRSLYSY